MTDTYIFGGDLSPSNSAVRYLPINAVFAGVVEQTTEADAEVVIPCAGTLTSFGVQQANAPGASNDWIYTVRKNGADTDIEITHSGTGSGDGVTETTIDAPGDFTAVSVAAGDRLCLQTDPNSTSPSNTGRLFWWVKFESDETGETPNMVQAVSTTVSSTFYYPLSGGNGSSSNVGRTNAEERHNIIPTAGDLLDMYVQLASAPGSGTSFTFDLVSDFGGSETTLKSVTISDTDTTGSDTSAADAITAGDNLALKVTFSGSPATGQFSVGWVFKGSNTGESLILHSHYAPATPTGIQGTGRITDSTFNNVAQPIGPVKVTKSASHHHDTSITSTYVVQTGTGTTGSDWSDSAVALSSETSKIVTIGTPKTFTAWERAAWTKDSGTTFTDGSWALVVDDESGGGSDVDLGTVAVDGVSTASASVVLNTASLGSVQADSVSTVAASIDRTVGLGPVQVDGVSTVTVDLEETTFLGTVTVAGVSEVTVDQLAADKPLGTVGIDGVSTVTVEVSVGSGDLGDVTVASDSTVTVTGIDRTVGLGPVICSSGSTATVALSNTRPLGTVEIAGVANLNVDVSAYLQLAAVLIIAASTVDAELVPTLAPFGERVRIAPPRPDVTLSKRRRSVP